MAVPDDQHHVHPKEVFARRVLAAFAVLWATGCVALFFLLVWPIVMQWRAEAFPAAEGTVISSEVREVERTRQTSERGPVRTYTSYDFFIDYAYEVDGREYRGARYRFGSAHRDLSRRAAERLAERYPAGATVAVFHDPFNPRWATLEQGLRDRDRGMITFSLPFYIVLALIIWRFGASKLQGWLLPQTGGVRVRQFPNRLRIHWPSATLIDAMLLGACGVSFALIFVVAGGMNFALSAGHATMALGAILGAGPMLGAIVWVVRRKVRPRVSEIDLATQVVVVPNGPPSKGLGKGTAGPWTEHFDELLDVDVNNQAGREGASQRRFPAAVVLHLRRGSEERAVCLCELMSSQRAKVLMRWLLNRLPVTESVNQRN